MTADVVIVGGGFAGLSAATALAERGARVVVVDARPQLGGRATAFVDRSTGELVDNGQHVLFGCYHATFEFLRRIGAMENVRVMPSLEVPYIDALGRRSVLKCPPLPSPLHLLGAVLDWDAMPWRDRLSVLRLAGPLRRARKELRLTGTVSADPPGSVSDWLRAHGQGPKLTAWLWEPLAVAALNQSPGTASAAPFVRILAEMFGPDPSAAAIVLPTRPLHRMYAEPARDYLAERGSETRTNALARLVFPNDRVEGVDIRGERVFAPAVIAAVPWFGLRGLAGLTPSTALEPILAAADAIESMPIVTVNLWYDRRVMDDVFVGLPGRKMQWVFDKRREVGDTASHLSLISSGALELTRMDRDELIALAVREVADALPLVRKAQLVRATVMSERQATFSLARSASSGQARSARSGQARSARSGQARSASSGQARSASSGQAPSTGSGQAPSTGSGQARSARSGQAPSTGSGQTPSTGSGQAPSTGSGQAPSTGSGQAPGQPARPGTRTPVEGLYLAGDWIDTGLPGTIESAVRAGHQAAAAVLGQR